MVEWLRRYRLIKSTSEPDDSLIAELFRSSAGRFACPSCQLQGLVVSASEPLDDEEWGEGRKCESCGGCISPERLEAFPDARLCVACQGREDRGEPIGPAEYCPRCGSIMVLKQSRGSGTTRYVMTCPGCRRR
jgi:hypothetical protein